MKPRDKNTEISNKTALRRKKKVCVGMLLLAVGLASDTDWGINLHVYATVSSSTSAANCLCVAISSNYEGHKSGIHLFKWRDGQKEVSLA